MFEPEKLPAPDEMGFFFHPALNKGEKFVGVIISADGTRRHYLILLPGDNDGDSWQEAMDWAFVNGGELPTRREQALLYANLKEQFEDNWYWSCEQHVSASDFAWGQSFYYGIQDYYHTSSRFRARAVRRLAI